MEKVTRVTEWLRATVKISAGKVLSSSTDLQALSPQLATREFPHLSFLRAIFHHLSLSCVLRIITSPGMPRACHVFSVNFSVSFCVTLVMASSLLLTPELVLAPKVLPTYVMFNLILTSNDTI